MDDQQTEKQTNEEQLPARANTRQSKEPKRRTKPEDRYMRRAKTTLNIQTWISVIVCVAAIAWGILYAIIH